MASDDELNRARDLLRQAERVMVLTGAGISTDSGIRDFRGPQGVWTRDPEAEKLATLDWYMRDPEIRRRAWEMRLASGILDAKPNAGHHALLSLLQAGKLSLLVTQNIDGLHQRAGIPAERVVEIHGTVREVVCMACGERGPAGPTLARVTAGDPDPACLSCGGILKSATISFGQSLVAEDLARAEREALRCDTLLAVGSTLSVFPIAGVVPIARHRGARVIIVNGQSTEMDELADVVLLGPIGELLPQLLAGAAIP